MDEFTPITTQADFDAAVQPLIEAAVSAKAAEYEGWLSPEAHQEALETAKTAHRTALLKAYRAKAAAVHGLPEELTERLSGETEEEITADAQSLSELFRKSAPPSPKFSADETTDTRTAAQLEMLAALKK